MGDWLGTGRVANQLRQYRTFEQAREFVHTLGLHSVWEWEQYCKSGIKPEDIPWKADKTYKKDWTSWGDWLGTGKIADQYRVYRPFEKARQYVHTLELKNHTEWKKYCKSEKPQDIPVILLEPIVKNGKAGEIGLELE